MSDRKRAASAVPAAAARDRDGSSGKQNPVGPEPGAGSIAVEQRLAGIHLRLGSFALARAELEHLAAAEHLDVPGLADLAEVRWRMGDLQAAAEAAAAHLAANGVEPIARVIAAEAAAASGRPAEARLHSAAVAELTAADLDVRFAGMPRRAHWPAAPAGPAETLEAFGPDAGATGRPAARVRVDRDAEPVGAADPAPVDDQGPGLWTAHEGGLAGDRPRPAISHRAADVDPAHLMGRARAEIRSGNADRLAAGLDRLALALRLDPTLAPGVLEALGRRPEAAALLLRGDACRILGRTQEAEAAYLAAAAALDTTGFGEA
jgi:hypothetical protein